MVLIEPRAIEDNERTLSEEATPKNRTGNYSKWPGKWLSYQKERGGVNNFTRPGLVVATGYMTV